jgi:hypothetical protein
MLSFEDNGASGAFFVDIEKEMIDQAEHGLIDKMAGLTVK